MEQVSSLVGFSILAGKVARKPRNEVNCVNRLRASVVIPDGFVVLETGERVKEGDWLLASPRDDLALNLEWQQWTNMADWVRIVKPGEVFIRATNKR
jgi:hypothetical protein